MGLLFNRSHRNHSHIHMPLCIVDSGTDSDRGDRWMTRKEAVFYTCTTIATTVVFLGTVIGTLRW